MSSRWAGPAQTNNTRFTSADDWSLRLIPVLSVVTSSRDAKSKEFLSVHRHPAAPVNPVWYGVTFLRLLAEDRKTMAWRRSLSLRFCYFFGYVWQSPGRHRPREKGEMSSSSFSAFLIDDLVYGGLLVPRSGDNVLVIHGYIAAQHRGRLFRLETERERKP